MAGCMCLSKCETDENVGVFRNNLKVEGRATWSTSLRKLFKKPEPAGLCCNFSIQANHYAFSVNTEQTEFSFFF